MWKDKPKGVKVASSDPHHHENLKKEVEANRQSPEWKELMARGWKPAIESSRPKVKASEIKHPKKVAVTCEGRTWALIVSWEYYQKKGAGCKIVAEFY